MYYVSRTIKNDRLSTFGKDSVALLFKIFIFKDLMK